jgi:hypothetical protein
MNSQRESVWTVVTPSHIISGGGKEKHLKRRKTSPTSTSTEE